MNWMFFKKVLLFFLIASILCFGVTGCEDLEGIIYPENSDENSSEEICRVTLVLPVQYYNIYVDGTLKFKDWLMALEPLVFDVPYGLHTIEAQVTRECCKKDDIALIFNQSEITISLNPEPQDADVYIHLTSTYSGHHYNLYVDGVLEHANVPVGSYKIEDVSNDENHHFEVIHHKGPSFGSASQNVHICACEENVPFNISF